MHTWTLDSYISTILDFPWLPMYYVVIILDCLIPGRPLSWIAAILDVLIIKTSKFQSWWSSLLTKINITLVWRRPTYKLPLNRPDSNVTPMSDDQIFSLLKTWLRLSRNLIFRLGCYVVFAYDSMQIKGGRAVGQF